MGISELVLHQKRWAYAMVDNLQSDVLVLREAHPLHPVQYVAFDAEPQTSTTQILHASIPQPFLARPWAWPLSMLLSSLAGAVTALVFSASSY